VEGQWLGEVREGKGIVVGAGGDYRSEACPSSRDGGEAGPSVTDFRLSHVRRTGHRSLRASEGIP
jgi:hypothetical protein